MPELIGIGVGPGDPELLTVKAVNAIHNADVIMCPASEEDRPSIAFSVVSSLIDKSKNQEIVRLIFPMTKDKELLEKAWKKNAKIMAENVSVHCVATNIMRTTEWDFMAVYYDMIDHFCHAFMKYHPPKQKAVPQNMFEVYKDAVKSSYRFQDMMLEKILDLAGEEVQKNLTKR